MTGILWELSTEACGLDFGYKQTQRFFFVLFCFVLMCLCPLSPLTLRFSLQSQPLVRPLAPGNCWTSFALPSLSKSWFLFSSVHHKPLGLASFGAQYRWRCTHRIGQSRPMKRSGGLRWRGALWIPVGWRGGALLLCHLPASPALTYDINSLTNAISESGCLRAKGYNFWLLAPNCVFVSMASLLINHPSKWEVQQLVDAKCHPRVPFFQVAYSDLQQNLFLYNPDKLC